MKLLALVNAHALAHVSRCLEPVKILKKNGHEVAFAGMGKYLEIAEKAGFETFELPYVTEENIIACTHSGRIDKLFPQIDMQHFIKHEKQLITKFKPDGLIIDNRITAYTTAEIMGIKTVGMFNVHISSFKAIPYYSLRNTLFSKVPLLSRCLDLIENKIEALFFDRMVMKGLKAIRKEMGLKSKFGFEYEAGDINLLPDVPNFNPGINLPLNAYYVGPITWMNNLPAPRCLQHLDASKKTIYFTIGSAGIEELISELLNISENDYQYVVAAGHHKESLNINKPNVFIEGYINADYLLPHCDLVVCHGGNGTIYQALSHGLPIVGIASHEEQMYGLNRLNQLKLGIGFRGQLNKKTRITKMLRAIKTVIANDYFFKNAKAYQQHLRYWDGPKRAAEIIEKYFGAE